MSERKMIWVSDGKGPIERACNVITCAILLYFVGYIAGCILKNQDDVGQNDQVVSASKGSDLKERKIEVARAPAVAISNFVPADPRPQSTDTRIKGASKIYFGEHTQNNATTFAWLGSSANNSPWEIPLDIVRHCWTADGMREVCGSKLYSPKNTKTAIPGILVRPADGERLGFFLGLPIGEVPTEEKRRLAGITSTVLLSDDGQTHELLVIPFQLSGNPNPEISWLHFASAFRSWCNALLTDNIVLSDFFPRSADLNAMSIAQRSLLEQSISQTPVPTSRFNP